MADKEFSVAELKAMIAAPAESQAGTVAPAPGNTSVNGQELQDLSNASVVDLRKYILQREVDSYPEEDRQRFLTFQVKNFAARQRKAAEDALAKMPTFEVAQPTSGFRDPRLDFATQQRVRETKDPHYADRENYKLAVKFAERTAIEDPDRAGAARGFARATHDPEKLVPVMGGIVEARELIPVMKAAWKMENGQQLTGAEQTLLNSFAAMVEAQKVKSPDALQRIAEGATEIALSTPAFSAEFMLTGGAFTAGRAAGQKMTFNVAKKIIGERLANAVSKGAGFLAGGAVQTAVQPGALAAGLTERQTRPVVLSDKGLGKFTAEIDKNQVEDFTTSLAKSFGSHAVENLSERTGEIPQMALGRLKEWAVKRWMLKNGIPELSPKVQETLKKLGWHGILPELFEEQVAKPFQNAIEGKPLTEGFTVEQFATETLGFAAYGTAQRQVARGADTMLKRIEQKQREQERQWIEQKRATMREASRRRREGIAGAIPEEGVPRIDIMPPAQAEALRPQAEEVAKDLREKPGARGAGILADMTLAATPDKATYQPETGGYVLPLTPAQLEAQRQAELNRAAGVPESMAGEKPLPVKPLTRREREDIRLAQQVADAKKLIEEERARAAEAVPPEGFRTVDNRLWSREQPTVPAPEDSGQPRKRNMDGLREIDQYAFDALNKELTAAAQAGQYESPADMIRSLTEKKGRGVALTPEEKEILRLGAEWKAAEARLQVEPLAPVPTEAIPAAETPVAAPVEAQAPPVSPQSFQEAAEAYKTAFTTGDKEEATRLAREMVRLRREESKASQPGEIVEAAKLPPTPDQPEALAVEKKFLRSDEDLKRAKEIVLRKLGKPKGDVLFQDEEQQEPSLLDDRELMGALIDIGTGHYERGKQDFKEWSTAVLQDTGEAVQPFLDVIYAAVRDFIEEEVAKGQAPPTAETPQQIRQRAKNAKREADLQRAAKTLSDAAKSSPTPEEADANALAAQEARKQADELRRQRLEAERAARVAAQREAEQPTGTPIQSVSGKATDIIIPGQKEKFPARYAVVSAKKLVPSHVPKLWTKNDNAFQPRNSYGEDKGIQFKVLERGHNPETGLLHNTNPTAETGPPIIRSDGLVAGGNSRTMLQLIAYQDGYGKAIYDDLVANAPAFGIDPAQIPSMSDWPVLVRILDQDYTNREQMFKIGDLLNFTSTEGMSQEEKAVAVSKYLTEEDVDLIADLLAKNDWSVRDLMREKEPFIVELMEKRGIIEPTKRSLYVQPGTKNLTAHGKDLFESAVLGKVIPDAALLAEARSVVSSILNKIGGSLAPLVRIRSREDSWDISDYVSDALRLHISLFNSREAFNKFRSMVKAEIREAKDKEFAKRLVVPESIIDWYLHPEKYPLTTMELGFEEGSAKDIDVHPITEAIAVLLDDESKQVRKAFSDYIRAAELGDDTDQGGFSFAAAPHPWQGFNTHIGKPVGVEVSKEDWGQVDARREDSAPSAAVVEQEPVEEVSTEPAIEEGGEPAEDAGLSAALEELKGFEVLPDQQESVDDYINSLPSKMQKEYAQAVWDALKAGQEPPMAPKKISNEVQEEITSQLRARGDWQAGEDISENVSPDAVIQVDGGFDVLPMTDVDPLPVKLKKGQRIEDVEAGMKRDREAKVENIIQTRMLEERGNKIAQLQEDSEGNLPSVPIEDQNLMELFYSTDLPASDESWQQGQPMTPQMLEAIASVRQGEMNTVYAIDAQLKYIEAHRDEFKAEPPEPLKEPKAKKETKKSAKEKESSALNLPEITPPPVDITGKSTAEVMKEVEATKGDVLRRALLNELFKRGDAEVNEVGMFIVRWTAEDGVEYESGFSPVGTPFGKRTKAEVEKAKADYEKSEVERKARDKEREEQIKEAKKAEKKPAPKGKPAPVQQSPDALPIEPTEYARKKAQLAIEASKPQEGRTFPGHGKMIDRPARGIKGMNAQQLLELFAYRPKVIYMAYEDVNPEYGKDTEISKKLDAAHEREGKIKSPYVIDGKLYAVTMRVSGGQRRSMAIEFIRLFTPEEWGDRPRWDNKGDVFGTSDERFFGHYSYGRPVKVRKQEYIMGGDLGKVVAIADSQLQNPSHEEAKKFVADILNSGKEDDPRMYRIATDAGISDAHFWDIVRELVNEGTVDKFNPNIFPNFASSYLDIADGRHPFQDKESYGKILRAVKDELAKKRSDHFHTEPGDYRPHVSAHALRDLWEDRQNSFGPAEAEDLLWDMVNRGDIKPEDLDSFRYEEFFGKPRPFPTPTKEALEAVEQVAKDEGRNGKFVHALWNHFIGKGEHPSISSYKGSKEMDSHRGSEQVGRTLQYILYGDFQKGPNGRYIIGAGDRAYQLDGIREELAGREKQLEEFRATNADPEDIAWVERRIADLKTEIENILKPPAQVEKAKLPPTPKDEAKELREQIEGLQRDLEEADDEDMAKDIRGQIKELEKELKALGEAPPEKPKKLPPTPAQEEARPKVEAKKEEPPAEPKPPTKAQEKKLLDAVTTDEVITAKVAMRQLAEAFPNVSREQLQAVIALWELRAKKQGVTLDEWVKKTIAGAQKGGDPDANSLFQAFQTSTKEFKTWFGKSQVVDDNGRPLVVFHGTTADFSTFDRRKVGIESYFGKGFHFTDDPRDAGANYTGEGTDVKGRIEREAEYQADVKNISIEEARKQVEAKLKKHEGFVMPVYVKMERPINLDSEEGTWFQTEFKYNRAGDVVAEKGNGPRLYRALLRVSKRYGVNGEKAWHELNAALEENGHSLLDGVPAFDVEDKLRHDVNELGKVDEIGQFIQDVFRSAGFDGIIMTAADYWPNWISDSGVNPNVRHFITFDRKNIKSALGNRGTFGQPPRAFDGIGDTFSAKELSNRLATDASFLRGLFETRTFKEKGLDGLDIPSRRIVVGRVLSVLQEPQVREAVVGLLPVKVVNILRAKQLAPQVFLHDVSMLANLFSVNSNNAIPFAVNESTELIHGITGAIAKYAPTLTELGSSTSDQIPAGLASSGDRRGAQKSSVASLGAEDFPTLANARGEPSNQRSTGRAGNKLSHFAVAYNQSSGLSTIEPFDPKDPNILHQDEVPDSVIKAIEEGGGIFRGLQKGTPQTGNLVYFDDPITKSTLGLWEGTVTAEAVRNHIAEHRARYVSVVTASLLKKDKDVLFQQDSPVRSTRGFGFQSWFSGSKVVDRNGEPKVVYHATGLPNFTVFDPAKQHKFSLYGPGFYFTEDAEVASGRWDADSDLKAFDTEEEAKNARGRIGFHWKDDTRGKWMASIYKPKMVDPGYVFKGVMDRRVPPEERQAYVDAIEKSRDYDRAMSRGYLTVTEQGYVNGILDDFKRGGYLWQLPFLNEQPYNIDARSILFEAGLVGPGATYPVYLRIRNPLDMDAPLRWEDAERLAQGAMEAFGADVAKKLMDMAEDNYAIQRGEKAGNLIPPREALLKISNDFRIGENVVTESGRKSYLPLSPEYYQRLLKASGFDGMTHIGGSIVGKKQHRVWVAFDSPQVKSAIGNTGDFDPTNPDILYQREERQEAAYEMLTRIADQVARPKNKDIIERLRSQMADKRAKTDIGLMGMAEGDRFFGAKPSDEAVRGQIKVIIDNYALEEPQAYTPQLVMDILRAMDLEDLAAYVTERRKVLDLEDVLYQREPAPLWVSKAAVVAEMKMTGPMSGEQLLKTLRNNGVKETEIEALGLEGWLEGKARVTPEEVQEFIASNNVEVQEIVLSDEGAAESGLPRLDWGAPIEGEKREEMWPTQEAYEASGTPVEEEGPEAGFIYRRTDPQGRNFSIVNYPDLGVHEAWYGEPDDTGELIGAYSNFDDATIGIHEYRVNEEEGESRLGLPAHWRRLPPEGTKFRQWMLPGGPLSRDTEILTDAGWKRIDKVEIGETVLTRKDEYGDLEWAPIEAKPKIFAKELYHFRNQSIDMMVTACHQMVVKRRRRSKCGTMRVTAEQLWRMSEALVPLTGAPINQAGTATLFGLPAGDVAEFVGWYLAEGSHKIDNGVKTTLQISQSKKANPANCIRLESLFDRLGLKWKYYQNGPAYGVGVRNMPKDLARLLHEQPTSSGKFIPKLFFKQSANVIARLVESLILGDGNVVAAKGARKSRSIFFSKSHALASDVQALLQLIGKRASVRQRPSGLYVVAINQKQWASVDDAKYAIAPYGDFAFCVTVKNHAVYVRRNGIAAWTGNSNYREVIFKLPYKGGLTPEQDKEFERLAAKEARRKISKQEKDELKNLRELQLKSYPLNFTGSHFDNVAGGNGANVFAHGLMDDRIDSDGKRVLLVHENQSDWARLGKKQGYAPKQLTEEQLARLDDLGSRAGLSDAETAEHEALARQYADSTRGIMPPDFPFKNNWHELVMKRILRMAVDEGYDRVTWSTGAIVQDRYDLSKRVDMLRWNRRNGLLEGWKSGENVITVPAVAENDLDKYVGKEVAQRLRDQNPSDEDFKPGDTVTLFKGGKQQRATVIERWKDSGHKAVPGEEKWKALSEHWKLKILDGPSKGYTGIFAREDINIAGLSNLDLKVGGEWAEALYDRAIPNFLRQYTKKWGAKIGTTKIAAGPYLNVDGVKVAGVDQGRDGRWYIFNSDTGEKINPSSSWDNEEDALNALKIWEDEHKNVEVHYIDITPEMKEAIGKGQYLFQSGFDKAAADKLIPQARKLMARTNSWNTFKERLAAHLGVDVSSGINNWDVPKEWMYAQMRARGLTEKEALRAIGEPLRQNQTGIGGPKGAAKFLADGRALIIGFASGDISTLVHETAHILRRDLTPEEQKTANKIYGQESAKWSVEAEEKFARDFERYLYDGDFPGMARELRKIFEKMRDWLRQVYVRLIGSPISEKLTPEKKELFNRILGVSQAEVAQAEKQAAKAVKAEKKEVAAAAPAVPAESQTETPATEIWKLTRAEYQTQQKAKGEDADFSGLMHKNAVAAALGAGLPVPKEVYSRYPDIEDHPQYRAAKREREVAEPPAPLQSALVDASGHRLKPVPTKAEAVEAGREAAKLAPVGHRVLVSDEEFKAAVERIKAQQKKILFQAGDTDKVLYYTKRGESGMVTVPWTQADENSYRAEMERRFRENTPPAEGDIYRIDWRDRVARSEMRNWSSENLGKHPPETEEQWIKDNAKWYRKMAKKAMKELGEGQEKDPDILFQSGEDWLRELKRDTFRIGAYVFESGTTTFPAWKKQVLSYFDEDQRGFIAPFMTEMFSKLKAIGEARAKAMLSSGLPEDKRIGVIKTLEMYQQMTLPLGKTPAEEEAAPISKRLLFLTGDPNADEANGKRKGADVSDQDKQRGEDVREASRTSEPEVRKEDAGAPRGDQGPGEPERVKRAVKGARPAYIAPASRQRGAPIYDEQEWKDRLEEVGLPFNIPVPTRALSDEIAEKLLPGQTEILEVILSAFDQYDAAVSATSTGTGKTFQASALLASERPASALVVTKNQKLAEEFIETAALFGVTIEKMPTDLTKMKEDGYYVTTYSALPKDIGRRFGIVIADEAGEARRWYTTDKKKNEKRKKNGLPPKVHQGEKLISLTGNADKVLFMSATPFHTPVEVGYLEKLGLWKGQTFEDWVAQFGVRKDKDGNWDVPPNPKRMALLREQLMERGVFVNWNRNMEGFNANFGVVPLTVEQRQEMANAYSAIDKATSYFEQKGLGGLVMASKAIRATFIKNYLERARLKEAIELGRKLDAAGWKVIFFSENKAARSELYDFLHKADKDMGGALTRLMPKLPGVWEELQKAFGDEISNFSGSHSEKRTGQLDDFTVGRAKHVFTTYASGGVGVSLHDKHGDAPRAVIHIGAPWSGVMFDQALGRSWRFGTKSNVHAIFLASDAKAEMDLMTNKVGARLTSLRAGVSGINYHDPVAKAMMNIEEAVDKGIDYALGGGSEPLDSMDSVKDAERIIQNWKQIKIIPAEEAMNKGMKMPPSLPRLRRLSTGEQRVKAAGESLLFQMGHNDDAADKIGEKAKRLLKKSALKPPPTDAVGAELDDIVKAVMSVLEQHIKTDKEKAEVIDQITRLAKVNAATVNGNKTPAIIGTWQDVQEIIKQAGDTPVSALRAFDEMYLTQGLNLIAAVGGEVGQRIRNMRDEYHLRWGEIGGPWVVRMYDIRDKYKLTKDDFPKIWDAIEKNDDLDEPRLEEAKEAIQQLKYDVQDMAVEKGVEIEFYDDEGKFHSVPFPKQRKPNYMPHRWDQNALESIRALRQKIIKEKKEQLIESIMEKNGVTRAQAEVMLQEMGRDVPLAPNIERPREINLPGYSKTMDAFIAYLEDAAEVVARAEVFGQKRGKLYGELAQLRDDPRAVKLINELFDALLARKNFHQSSSVILRAATTWAVVTKMGLSQIPNAFQWTSAAWVTDSRSAYTALLEVMADYKEAWRDTLEAGAIFEQSRVELMHEFGAKESGLAQKFLRTTRFFGTDMLSRIVTIRMAKVYLENRALPALIGNPEDKFLRRHLVENFALSNEVIDEAIANKFWQRADILRAGKKLSDETQFTFDPLEKPAVLASGAEKEIQAHRAAFLRILFILKSFAFKQAVLAKKYLYQEAAKGNMRPWVPTFLVMMPFGALVFILRRLMVGDVEGVKEFFDIDDWPDALLAMFDAFNSAGGVGILTTPVDAVRFDRGAFEIGAGPVVGDIATGFEAIINTAQVLTAEETGRERKTKAEKIGTIAKRTVKRVVPASKMVFNTVGDDQEEKRKKRQKQRGSSEYELAPVPED